MKILHAATMLILFLRLLIRRRLLEWLIAALQGQRPPVDKSGQCTYSLYEQARSILGETTSEQMMKRTKLTICDLPIMIRSRFPVFLLYVHAKLSVFLPFLCFERTDDSECFVSPCLAKVLKNWDYPYFEVLLVSAKSISKSLTQPKQLVTFYGPNRSFNLFE